MIYLNPFDLIDWERIERIFGRGTWLLAVALLVACLVALVS